MDDKNDLPAAARVFAIPELLENVFIQMIGLNLEQARKSSRLSQTQQLKSLFRLQRVNKTFQSVLKRSRTCRQAMFLEHTYDGSNPKHPQFQFNPLACKLLPLHEFHVRTPELHFELEVSSTYNAHLPGNSMAYLSKFEASIRKEASWLQMLFSNTRVETQLVSSALYLNSKGQVVGGCTTSERLEEDTTLGGLVSLFIKEVHEIARHRQEMDLLKRRREAARLDREIHYVRDARDGGGMAGSVADMDE